MVTTSLRDHSDASIVVNGAITKTEAGVDDVTKRRENKKGAIFTNFAPFTDCMSKINNT